MTEEASTATSVSKGCFAYKGTVKKARAEDYLPKENSIKERLARYQELWDEIHLQISSLQADVNSKIFEDLVRFIELNDGDTFKTDEIPTAVLITGINTPDHEVMFCNLESILKSTVTQHVARICSKDCSSLKSVVSSILMQITKKVSADVKEFECKEKEEDEEQMPDGDGTFKLHFAGRGNRSVSMSTLVEWYKREYTQERKLSNGKSPTKESKGGHSPKKKIKRDITQDQKSYIESKGDEDALSSCFNTKEEGKKLAQLNGQVLGKDAIVVLLEDVESMPSNVLQDFITICSTHLYGKVPVFLVMGVATAITAVHNLLPSSVTSLIRMETFRAPEVTDYFDKLLNKVVLSADFPFKLGHSVFHHLLDTFLFHDFSIINFTASIQLCMLQHFMTNPLSLLCCKRENVDEMTENLTHGQLEDIRRHKSVMSFVEQMSSQEQVLFLTDDKAMRRLLKKELHEFHNYHTVLYPMLRYFICLCCGCNDGPEMGGLLREALSLCLSGGEKGTHLCDSEFFLEKFDHWGKTAELATFSDIMKEPLDICQPELKDSKWNEFTDNIDSWIKKLVDLSEEQAEEETVKDMDTHDSEINKKIHSPMPRRAKLHELKEHLLTRSSQETPCSKWFILRNQILHMYDKHFREKLASPYQLAFHEAFYLKDAKRIKPQLLASPRSAIQRALAQPGVYLNCFCCQCEPDSITSTMPDVCIVYKLHLECGTLVNLYDWLQAFALIISSTDEENAVASGGTKSKKNAKPKNNRPTVEVQARFIRAVSELQFLGFIKSTRRKTDHVTRLTW